MHLRLPFWIVYILLSLSLSRSTNGVSHRKDERITDIKKEKEIDQLKSYKNGSIVLFFESNDRPTKRVEQTLLKANNDLKIYGFKLRRLDCKKFSKLKECRAVDEPIVYMFKKGDWRTYGESELSGIDLAINQILFFMANARHDKMMDCSNTEQMKEFVEINSKHLNTVVGSFQQKNSEYLRRFLEVVMEKGKEVAFLLMSGNQVDQSMYNKRGFFIRFYYSLQTEPGKETRYDDISDSARTRLDLLKSITIMNLADEYKMHQKNLDDARQAQRDAPKIKERIIRKEQEKALKKVQAKMAAQNSRQHKKKTERPKQVAEKPKPKLSKEVEEGISEISRDAFTTFSERDYIPQRNEYRLNEPELRDVISKNEGISNGILVVMFYVYWEPTFQMFEPHFKFLAEKYKTDLAVNFAQLDCSAWITICTEHEIMTYPTILIFRNKMKPFTYKGSLESENIAKHITYWKDPLLPQLSDIRQLKEITKQMKRLFLMGVFTNDTTVIDVRQKEFEKIAHDYYGIIRIGIAIVKDKEIDFNKEKHTLPIVIAGNANGERGRLTHTNKFDKEELIGWINDQKREKVEQLTYKNFPSLVAIRKPFLISFQSKHKDLSALYKFANKFSDLITVWMDEDCELSEYIMDSYKIKRNGSKIVILDKVKNKVFEFTGAKKTIGNVAKWVKDCFGDTEKYATHSLTNFKEVFNEGYDFLALLGPEEEDTDDISEENEEAQALRRRLLNHFKIVTNQTGEDDIGEDREAVYQSYKKLKYRPEMRREDDDDLHDEL